MILKRKHTIHVLYVWDARFISGLEIVLLNIFKAIDRNSFTPYFVGSKWTDGKFIAFAQKLGVKCSTTRLGFISRSLNLLRLARYAFDFFVSNLSIALFIIKNKIDIIHANSLQMCWYVYLASVISRRPIIWHENATMQSDSLRRWIVSILDNRIKLYIAVSFAVKDHLVALGVKSEKIEVVYNTTDTGLFDKFGLQKIDFRKKFQLPDDSLLVGLIGQLAPWKGHKDFIRAASLVNEKVPQARFIIVGQRKYDVYECELERMIKEAGMEGKIIFAGWFDQMPPVYLGLDVTVLATISQEPFGLVVIEAMAATKPVVVTKVGAMPEIVVDGVTGIFVDPAKPEAMAEALSKVLINKELALNMGIAGRARVKEMFALNKIIKDIEVIYKKAL